MGSPQRTTEGCTYNGVGPRQQTQIRTTLDVLLRYFEPYGQIFCKLDHVQEMFSSPTHGLRTFVCNRQQSCQVHTSHVFFWLP